MSRLTFSQLGGRWLIWGDRAEVRAMRRSIFSTVAYTKIIACKVETASQEGWFNACEDVLAQIRDHVPLSVNIALPQFLTPCFDVSLGDRDVGPALVDAYLRGRFEQVFGEPSEGWRLRCDARVSKGKAVAFACDESAARRLQPRRLRTGVLHVVPFVCWGAERSRRLMARDSERHLMIGKESWYVQVEEDRLVALWMEQGRAVHVVLLPVASSASQALSDHLRQWEVRLGVTREGAAVLIGEPTDRPLEVLAVAGRRVARVGFFASKPKRVRIDDQQSPARKGGAWA